MRNLSMALSGAALPVIPTTTEQAAATSSADEPTTEAGAPSASAAEVESVDAAAVDAALTSLSDLADEAFGTDAVILAEQIRSAPGGIPTLVSRMQGGGGIHLEAQQDAMSILCNMLADSFDPNGASDTLNAFIAAGGLEAMLALLSKQDADNATLLFAAAMAQNATALDPRDAARHYAPSAPTRCSRAFSHERRTRMSRSTLRALWQTCARTTRRRRRRIRSSRKG